MALRALHRRPHALGVAALGRPHALGVAALGRPCALGVVASQSAPLPMEQYKTGLFTFLKSNSDWESLGDKPALVNGVTGASVSYAELEGRVNGAAHALRAAGFEQGDTLSIHMHNCPEYVIAFLTTAALGGISTTSIPLYTDSELSKQLSDSGAKFAISSESYREVVTEATATAGLPTARVQFIEGASCFANAHASSEPVVTERPIADETDLCTLPYSSGTTGPPMLSHHNL
eukprot:2093663-Prymnesium_polylepis.1